MSQLYTFLECEPLKQYLTLSMCCALWSILSYSILLFKILYSMKMLCFMKDSTDCSLNKLLNVSLISCHPQPEKYCFRGLS